MPVTIIEATEHFEGAVTGSWREDIGKGTGADPIVERELHGQYRYGATFGTPPERRKSIAMFVIARTPIGNARSSP